MGAHMPRASHARAHMPCLRERIHQRMRSTCLPGHAGPRSTSKHATRRTPAGTGGSSCTPCLGILTSCKCVSCTAFLCIKCHSLTGLLVAAGATTVHTLKWHAEPVQYVHVPLTLVAHNVHQHAHVADPDVSLVLQHYLQVCSSRLVHFDTLMHAARHPGAIQQCHRAHNATTCACRHLQIPVQGLGHPESLDSRCSFS